MQLSSKKVVIKYVIVYDEGGTKIWGCIMAVEIDKDTLSPEDISLSVGLDAVTQELHRMLWDQHKRLSRFDPFDMEEIGIVDAVGPDGQRINLNKVTICFAKPYILLMGKGIRVAYRISAETCGRKFTSLTFEYVDGATKIGIAHRTPLGRVHYTIGSRDQIKPAQIH